MESKKFYKNGFNVFETKGGMYKVLETVFLVLCIYYYSI